MISRYEQARYAAALGVNPTEHRDLVVRFIQDGRTGDELLEHSVNLTGAHWSRSPEALANFHAKMRERRTLSDDEVRQMRAMYATGRITLRALADRYGVHESHIHRIVQRRLYRDVA